MSDGRPHDRSSSLYIPYDGFTKSRSRISLRVVRSQVDTNTNGSHDNTLTLGGKGKDQQDVDLKELGSLEKKVDENDQVIRHKMSSINNRFVGLETHIMYVLSKSQFSPPRNSFKSLENQLKSPPVPAVKRKLEEAKCGRSFSMEDERENKMAKVTQVMNEGEDAMIRQKDVEGE